MNSTTNNHLSNSKALDWNQRPQEAQEKIGTSFNKLAQNKDSGWLYNGEKQYNICGIDEHKWLTAFLKNKCSERSEFYVMEIGAGNFSWGKAIAQTINQAIQDKSLPANISVTIISLRGEQNPDQESVQDGNCYLLNLGAFKIENLFEAFSQRNLDYRNQVDLIVSRMAFRLFVDPTGTLAQTFKHLRPETGQLFMDGFYMLYQDQTSNITNKEASRNIIQILFETKAPFAIKIEARPSINQFIVKRGSSDPLLISLEYQNVQKCNNGTSIEFVTQFKESKNTSIKLPQRDRGLYEKAVLYSDPTFCEELKSCSNDLQLKFYPIQIIEGAEEDFIFKAIQNNVNTLFEECINDGFRICSYNANGVTPLSLCIQLQQKEMFDRILEKDSSTAYYPNQDGNSPIHIAAQYDKEGYFIEKLIQAGAGVYDTNRQRQTPLDIAYTNNNEAAKKILEKHDLF